MAATSPLFRLAFVCIVLAVLVRTALSHEGHDHGPAMAPSHKGHNHGPTMAPSHEGHEHGHNHGPAMAPSHKGHNHGPTMAPAPSAATYSAYPQLIATALVGALSFLF